MLAIPSSKEMPSYFLLGYLWTTNKTGFFFFSNDMAITGIELVLRKKKRVEFCELFWIWNELGS